MTARPAVSSRSYRQLLAEIAALRREGRPDWHRRALCHGQVSAFFPSTVREAAAVAELCQSCPVIAECRESGSGEAFGIWAGVLHRPSRKRGHRPLRPPAGAYTATQGAE